jgi:hypothetical protein
MPPSINASSSAPFATKLPAAMSPCQSLITMSSSVPHCQLSTNHQHRILLHRSPLSFLWPIPRLRVAYMPKPQLRLHPRHPCYGLMVSSYLAMLIAMSPCHSLVHLIFCALLSPPPPPHPTVPIATTCPTVSCAPSIMTIDDHLLSCPYDHHGFIYSYASSIPCHFRELAPCFHLLIAISSPPRFPGLCLLASGHRLLPRQDSFPLAQDSFPRFPP